MSVGLAVPGVLATLGSGLLAVAVLAPRRAVPAATAPAAAAPPANDPAPAADATAAAPEPAWPLLLDHRAFDCDAKARLGLVNALATIHTPWAAAILESALVDETDERVRSSVREALAVPGAKRYAEGTA